MKEFYLFHKSLNLALISNVDPISWMVSMFVKTLSAGTLEEYQVIVIPKVLIFILLLLSLNHKNESKIELLLFCLVNTLLLYLLDPSLLIIGPCNAILLTLVSHRFYQANPNLNRRIISFIGFLTAIVISKPLSLIIFFIILAKKIHSKSIATHILLLLLGIFALIETYEQKPIFDYPRNSNLTPLSPMTHAGSTDLGIDNLPFSVDFAQYTTDRTNVINRLFLLTAIGLLASLFSRFNLNKIPLIAGSVFCIFLSILSITSLTNYFDLPLTRTIPGLAYIPLPGLIPIGVILYLLKPMQINKTFSAYTLTFGLAFVILLKGIPEMPDVFAIETGNTLPLNFTPSNYLLETYKGLKEANIGNPHTPIALQNSCTATASAESTNAHLAIDNNNNTRWATKRPQQMGDSFKIICNQEMQFSELELIIEKSPTDFPRGFSIILDGKAIVSLKDWLGPIRTTPKGLPYFGPQHEIDLTFNQQYTFKELEIKLENGDRSFDWSIGELKLFE